MLLDAHNLQFSHCFKLPNQNVMTHFERVRLGSAKVHRAVLYQDEDPQVILSKWLKFLEPLRTQWPTLHEFEIGLSKKVGPMSVMRPLSERLDDIDSYYTHGSSKGAPISEAAIDMLLREWSRIAGTTIKSQSDTLELMKKSTSSGSPFYTRRSDVLEETVPVGYCDDFNQTLNSHHYGSCAVLGWRGQEGGPTVDDVKQRVIWMFPFAINIRELQVYQPLIEECQRYNLVPAWIGMDEVDRRVTRLFDSKSSNDLVICTDFTKFDQHFNQVCQDGAEEILGRIFSHTETFDEWRSSVFPIKYNIPLAFDFGSLRKGHHGMGSGSGGTNADETIVHRALQHEAAMIRGQKLNPNSMCLGDDGIISYPGITIEEVTNSYTSHGLDMNLSKQYASAVDCTYLRRWYHTNYRINGVCTGVYSTARALGRLMYQEKFYDPKRWGKKQAALRQLSIIENCKWHPMRAEFARFCMKGDKYRLGLDIPGFLDDIDNIALEAIDDMQSFMSYSTGSALDPTNPGLSNWWIVNFLKGYR